MKTAELRPAYAWTCDQCGRDNFCNGIVAELSEEESAELRDEHGIDMTETGDWMRMPETVECRYCGDVFSTRHFHEEP